MKPNSSLDMRAYYHELGFFDRLYDRGYNMDPRTRLLSGAWGQWYNSNCDAYREGWESAAANLMNYVSAEVEGIGKIAAPVFGERSERR